METNKNKNNNEIIIENEFSLTDFYMVLSIIIKNFIIVISITILSIIFTIYYLKTTDYKYSTNLFIIPSDAPNNNSPAKQDNNFASIIGFQLPDINKNNNQFVLYKELIKSMTVSKKLYEDKKFMKTYYSNVWDNKNQKWILPNISNFQRIKNSIKTFLGLKVYKPHAPNEYTIYNYLKKKINIVSNKKTGITIISLESTNPQKGELLINKLHETADLILKERSIKRSEEHINFINQQLLKTIQIDQKQSLIIALAEEQKKRMMASSQLPYIAEPFDGKAQSSIFPTSPVATLLLLRNTFFGFFVGCLFPVLLVFIKTFYKKIKEY